MVKAGSRQENLNNSSVSNFAAYGALNGTAKYSKDKIDELVESFGGQLTVSVDREITQFTLSFESGFLAQAVELLSQIVLQPSYETVAHEALKAAIHKNASPMDPYTLSLESVHYTAYRVTPFLLRTTISDNLHLVTKMLSTLSLPNRLSNTMIISMLGATLLSAEQVISMVKTSPHKLELTSVQFQPSAPLKSQTVIVLSSPPPFSINVTTKCSTPVFLLPSKLLAGMILITLPWTTSNASSENIVATSSLENTSTQLTCSTTPSTPTSETTLT